MRKILIIKIMLFSVISAFSLDVTHDTVAYIVTAGKLNLREKPLLSSKVLQVLKRDTLVYFISEDNAAVSIDGVSGKWIKISLQKDNESSDTGYLFSGYLKKAEYVQHIDDRKDPLSERNTEFCLNSTEECWLAIDRGLLKKFSKLVVADGENIEIKLENNKKLILKHGDKGYRGYILQNYLKEIKYFIVFSWDDHGYALINGVNGTLTPIWQEKYLISPDNKYILIYNHDTEQAEFNSTQIVDLQSGKIVYSYSQPYELYNPVWLDADKIEFEKVYREHGSGFIYVAKGYLKKVDNVWIDACE